MLDIQITTTITTDQEKIKKFSDPKWPQLENALSLWVDNALNTKQDIDGNILKGAFRFLAESNTFISDFLGKTELYDLAFLNDDYFVLSKHGDQARKGQRRYFVMGREGVVSGLTWHEVLDQMFNIYRSSSRFIFFLVIAVVIISVILAWSLL